MMEMCVVRRVSIPVRDIGAFGGRHTVLLVTNDADLREAAGRALDAAGYDVVKAAHSGHALLAGLSGPPIHTLIAELATDDISGPNLAERLRRHHPGIRVMFIARPGTPDCEGVLVRPFTRDELYAKLEALTPLHSGAALLP